MVLSNVRHYRPTVHQSGHTPCIFLFDKKPIIYFTYILSIYVLHPLDV